jgi:putative iron-regulated protein
MKETSRVIAIKPYSSWLVLGCLLVSGCGSDDAAPATSGLPANAAQAAPTYAAIAHASYVDSLDAAQSLDDAVNAFVQSPSAMTRDAARQAWLAAREPYLQTEVYRFYDGPIDNPEDGPEGMVNAWPLDEAFIDYVDGDAGAGIVNNTAVTIDTATLTSMNESGGEENIATGFHAIEFLLWGQDLSETGPGARPHTDYVVGAQGTAQNQDRRGTYLTTASRLLVGHLGDLVAAWSDSSGNYRAEFVASGAKESLRRILTGMIVLSGFETGGERLQTALDSGDQEDEHSCFSDNTHRDMVQDIRGIQNVWSGSYTKLDGVSVTGVGIRAVVESADPALAAQLDATIGESARLANALVPPFDREISPGNAEGRGRVQALVTSLREQEEQLQRVFRLFGLTVPVVE